jgi:hypothetical protein
VSHPWTNPWIGRHRRGARFVLVPVEDARRHTGLELDELLTLPFVEEVTRIYVDGRREQALRVPAEFVPSLAGRLRPGS